MIQRMHVYFLFISWLKYFFNPCKHNVTFSYPLKTSENLRYSDVFTGYSIGTLGENGLTPNCQ